MEQPTIWGWVIFWLSTAGTLYAFWHMASGLLFGSRQAEAEAERPARPAPASLRQRLPWPLRIVDWIGIVTIQYVLVPAWRGAVGLLRALWGGSAPAAEPAPVSIISVSLPRDYVAGGASLSPQNAQTDQGLSGLSAAEPVPWPDAAALATLETLDSGSRKRAIALLLLDGWGTGKIRKVLTGDSGDIGREVAELRLRLGLEDDEAGPRLTPVAGRQTDADFRRTA